MASPTEMGPRQLPTRAGVLARACALLLGLALTCAPGSLRAGAWVPAAGEGLTKLSLLGLSADERWGCDGMAAAVDVDGSEYRERLVYAYAERGIGHRWALLGSFAWKDARMSGPSTYGTRSTADLQVGGRFALTTGATPVSLQAILSVPTYPRSELAAPVATRPQYLPAGSGQLEAELMAQVGRSLWPLPLYINGAVGYRARRGEYSDVWVANLEAGAASASFAGKAELRAYLPVADPCGASAAGSTTAAERVFSLAPEAAVRVAASAWLVAGVTIPVAGVNALRAAQWSTGLMFWKRGG